MMASMESIIGDGLEAIVSGISTFVSVVVDLFVGLVTSVIETLSGLGDQLFDIGVAIMESLRAGIESIIDSIISGIIASVIGIVDAVEGALGIESPSKVFVRVGRNMMEGMAVGLGEGAGMPAAAALGATRNVTNHFNLTVNTRATTSPVVQSFQTMRALV